MSDPIRPDPESEKVALDLERANAEIQRQEEVVKLLKARHTETEAALRRQIEQVSEDARAQRTKLRKVYASKTWKVGRLVVIVARAVRHPRWALGRLRARRGGIAQSAAAIKSITSLPLAAAPEAPSYRLQLDEEMEKRYQAAVDKRRFDSPDTVHLVMAVHTLDFAEGRGDIYTAVGLGRYLERIGYEVVYLPREEWYEVPRDTHVYLAMLDEVDLFSAPAHPVRIAWIRNRTTEWIESPSLPLYDAVLASSERSLAEVRRAFAGPAGILRIAVDHELFSGDAHGDRHGVVTTVNQWGRERQVFYALQRSKRDYPLAIYGEQRGLHQDLVPHWLGKVAYFGLPSLYRQAGIVLDDHNHTTQPFGNVNSRVYESLASGSLVFTNAALGLFEMGITEVPIYDSPADLERLIHEHLRDPAGARALAEKLRAQVLEEHTYEQRAAAFDVFYRGLGDERPRTGRRFVGFFPDYRHTNPYQSMLYSWTPERGISTLPVGQPASLLDTTLTGLGERFVYHIHWTAPILGGSQTEREAEKRKREFLEALDGLHAKGTRLIWTIHNVMPHECPFPEIEAELRQGLADRADFIHVMCERTGDLVRAHFALPEERVRIIPHPNYVGVYPNVIDQERARRELNLSPQDTVLCFMGGIRPYKGLDQLLDAFDQWSDADPDARLIVVGPAGRFPEVEELRERCRSNPRIISNFNHIGDGDLQVFINACDAVVLPHRAVLNSGSLMLAFSFGRPVIAPAAGCLDELLSTDVALTFDAHETLRDTISRTSELKADAFREAAYLKALQYPVAEIAEQFARLIDELTISDKTL